jgi:hypothetical protein
MPHTRLAALVATLTCALLIGAVGTASAATTQTSLAKTVSVTGKSATGKKLKNGTFTIDRFAKKGGKLYAYGTMRGRIGSRIFTKKTKMPASRPTTSSDATTSQAGLPPLPSGKACSVLSLDLGPINLNVLGLVVRTNQIQVRIDAVQGPGNLLGNLLCSVAHLLDSNTSGQGLASLLNQILRILG